MTEEPVLGHMTPVERPVAGIPLVARDAAAISPEMRATTDCDRLWEQGVQRGGVPADVRRQQVVLRGEATDGIEIIGMRAKVTGRGPAEGNAAIFCPSAGATEPTGLAFDLYSTDGPSGSARRSPIRPGRERC